MDNSANVPTSDEEVYEKFKSMYKDALVVKNMSGIYRLYRLEKNVVDTYLQTLQDFLDARK